VASLHFPTIELSTNLQQGDPTILLSLPLVWRCVATRRQKIYRSFDDHPRGCDGLHFFFPKRSWCVNITPQNSGRPCNLSSPSRRVFPAATYSATTTSGICQADIRTSTSTVLGSPISRGEQVLLKSPTYCESTPRARFINSARSRLSCLLPPHGIVNVFTPPSTFPMCAYDLDLKQPVSGRIAYHRICDKENSQMLACPITSPLPPWIRPIPSAALLPHPPIVQCNRLDQIEPLPHYHINRKCR